MSFFWISVAHGRPTLKRRWVHVRSPMVFAEITAVPSVLTTILSSTEKCILYSGLNFRQHFSQVSSSCFYHIRDLKRISQNLPLALAIRIAVAPVTSKLDYCNSLLQEIPAKDLHSVQNCLARVVTKTPRFSRSIPLLKLLHWLPIKFRIQFKMCTFVFRCLNDGQPSYLSSLLFSADYVKHLRSNNTNKLELLNHHVSELSSVLVPFLFPVLLSGIYCLHIV